MSSADETLSDHATTLRILVQPKSSPRQGGRESDMKIVTFPHRVIEVAGGSPGAGATTLARNLAAEAARCGISAVELDAASAHRLIDRDADFYFLSIGSSTVYAGLADYLLLVTTPGAASVAGACLVLRRHRSADPDLPAGLVVNRAASPGEGAATAERIASVALGLVPGPELKVLGWVLDDPMALAGSAEAPMVTSAPGSAAAAGIRMCVRRLFSGRRPCQSLLAA